MSEDIKYRVKQAITESFVNALPVTCPVDNSREQNDVFADAEIGTNVKFLGGVLTSVYDGVYTINTSYVASLHQITEYLDENPNIDGYDVTGYIVDALTGIVTTQDIDPSLQSVQSEKNISWKITAFTTPESTVFSPTYVSANGYKPTPNPIHGYSQPTNVPTYNVSVYPKQGNTVASQALEHGLYESITEAVSKEPNWLTSGKAVKTSAPGGKYVFVPKGNTLSVFVEYTFDKDTSAHQFYEKNKSAITSDIKSLYSGEVFNKLEKAGIKPKFADDKDYSLSEDFLDSQGNGKISTAESQGVVYTGNNISTKSIAEALGDGCGVSASARVLDEMKHEGKVKFKGNTLLSMTCKKGYVYDKKEKVCVKVGSLNDIKEGRIEDFASNDSMPNPKKLVRRVSLSMNHPTFQPKPTGSVQEGRVEDYANQDSMPNPKKMVKKMSLSMNRPTQTQARPTNVSVGDKPKELMGKSVTEEIMGERDQEEYGERPKPTPDVLDALHKHLAGL